MRLHIKFKVKLEISLTIQQLLNMLKKITITKPVDLTNSWQKQDIILKLLNSANNGNFLVSGLKLL